MKDVRLALDAGHGLSVPLPVASLVHDYFLEGIAHGLQEKDWAALGALAAERAGL
jgi:3-hydroxyisobutyrate dehydrogenase-like beta-hydroxyacid dehydrogenase